MQGGGLEVQGWIIWVDDVGAAGEEGLAYRVFDGEEGGEM